MWVPSHVGIIGKEKTDKSTVYVIKNISHPTICDLLTNDSKTSIKKKICAARVLEFNSAN